MTPHPWQTRIRETDPVAHAGRVRQLRSTHLQADGPAVPLGTLCRIERADADASGPDLVAEVVAVDRTGVTLIPLDDGSRARIGARVVALPTTDRVPVGDGFLGRATDPLGRPIDGGGPIAANAYAPLHGEPPPPLARATLSRQLATGIRAIDGLLPLVEGQRVGIFAAAGVGKTSLLAQLCLHGDADIVILALVGERGREVEAFWSSLPAEKRRRTVLVAATSDRSPMVRVRAGHYAMALAEHWRGRGRRVLLLLDSVTRLAMAMREIGLAAGEPPTVRAYTPNVFAAIPRLIERAGALASGGSISAIMTVLCETDAADDPLCEIMKSLLDGHILLSRELAEQGHFPAIDIARSVSRQASLVRSGEGRAAMQTVCSWISAFEQSRTMRQAGLYVPGNDPLIDQAVARHPAIERFLRQEGATAVSALETDRLLADLVRGEAA